MKNCPNCNALVEDIADTCPECGAHIGNVLRASEPSFTPKQKNNLKTIALIFCVTVICELLFNAPIPWKNNKKDKKYPAVKVLSYYIDERKADTYIFVVNYDFTNQSSEPQSFALTVQDEIYYNGVQCENSYLDYGAIDKHDKLAPKKEETITVGYKIPNFQPDKKYSFSIRLSEQFKSNSLFYKDEITSGIEIKKQKD